MQLFRQQAIDHQHRLYGEVLLVPPLRWRSIGGLLFVLVAAVAAFLIFGTYSHTIMASGVSGPAGRIALEVPASAIEQIAPGQEVRLTLVANPVQHEGILHGVIEQVGSVPVEDAQPENSQPFILVTARLAPPPGRQQSRDIALPSGMALDARIALAPRSLLQWIIDPHPATTPR